MLVLWHLKILWGDPWGGLGVVRTLYLDCREAKFMMLDDPLWGWGSLCFIWHRHEAWWHLIMLDDAWWSLMKLNEAWWSLMKLDDAWWRLIMLDDAWWWTDKWDKTIFYFLFSEEQKVRIVTLLGQLKSFAKVGSRKPNSISKFLPWISDRLITLRLKIHV